MTAANTTNVVAENRPDRFWLDRAKTLINALDEALDDALSEVLGSAPGSALGSALGNALGDVPSGVLDAPGPGPPSEWRSKTHSLARAG
jgi:hypothetical protein